MSEQISPVKVCFSGAGKAGSWKIRGEQISSARSNWKVAQDLTSQEINSFDVFCFVKRVDQDLLKVLKKRKKIVVFDIVDSWAQPDDGINFDNYDKVIQLFRGKWSKIQADAYIFPNQTMYKDFVNFVPYGEAIYHHYYPKITPIDLKPTAKYVVYEGAAHYLGEMRADVEKICRKLGLELLVNPENYSIGDIGISFRDGVHNSYLANRYKSNVKLANFYGAGMPCVCSYKEVSYHETDNGDVRFFTNITELEQQLDELRDYNVRRKIHESFLLKRKEFEIGKIVRQFEIFFLKCLGQK
jgi:hypothetical protein